jgi:tRNA threonylcarbamoyladenosine biosynthesis protein TsaB
MLLAIDTATRMMSLALHDGNRLIAEQSWTTPNRHTQDLAPAIQAALAESDTTSADLTALAVSIGPGSYTGVRIGSAMAKGLAAAKGLPVVGVTTLDTLAAGQPHYQNGSGLITVVQAGRGRIIVNTYHWRKGRWNSRIAPRLMDWETLLKSIDGPAYLTGEISDSAIEQIVGAQEKNVPVTLAPSANRLRRAGFLAEEAWTRLNEAGENLSEFEPSKLIPIYIKSDKADSGDS